MSDPAANDRSVIRRDRWIVAGTVGLLFLSLGIGWRWHTQQIDMQRAAHKNEMCRTCARMISFLSNDHYNVQRLDGLHVNAFKDCLPLAHTELTKDGKTRFTWAAESGEGVLVGGFVKGSDDRIEEPWSTFLH
jgi:hypothetical protein